MNTLAIVLRLVQRIPSGVWMTTAILGLVLAVGLALREGVRAIRADAIADERAHAAAFRDALLSLQAAAATQQRASAIAKTRNADSVVATRATKARQTVRALAKETRAVPSVDSLATATLALADASDTLRAVVQVERFITDTLIQLDTAQITLLTQQRAADRDTLRIVRRERDARLTPRVTAIVSAIAGGVGYLIARVHW